MAEGVAEEEDLELLDRNLKQLRLDYERYFLGTRPREPLQARAAVDKIIAMRAPMPSVQIP